MNTNLTINQHVSITSVRLILEVAYCQCAPVTQDTPYNELGLRPVKPPPADESEAAPARPPQPIDHEHEDPAEAPKSPVTGEPMTLVSQPRSITYRRNQFEINHLSYHCPASGQTYANKALDRINQQAAEDQYRERYNIPTPDEIRRIREQYGLSPQELSAVLGLGVNTYRRYEQGDMPQLSNARLIQLAGEKENFERLKKLQNAD